MKEAWLVYLINMMEDIRELRATPQLWNVQFYVLKKLIFGNANVKRTFYFIILQTLHNILQINIFWMLCNK